MKFSFSWGEICFIAWLFVVAVVIGTYAEMWAERPRMIQLETVINCVADAAWKYDAENKPAEALRIRKAIRRGLDTGKAVPLPNVERLLMRDMSRENESTNSLPTVR